MYLAVAIIDYIDDSGSLRTIKLSSNENVIIDNLKDIIPNKDNSSLDLGGMRIYNYDKCNVTVADSTLRNFSRLKNIIEFQIEHIGIPLLPNYKYTRGQYHFILPPKYRLLNIWISDPYDKKNKTVETKKQFKYNTFWDSNLQTQLVQMELSSRHGSFSFILKGKAILFDESNRKFNNKTTESNDLIADINPWSFDPEAISKARESLIEKVRFLELKPNIAGIGINVNEIISHLGRIFGKKR